MGKERTAAFGTKSGLLRSGVYGLVSGPHLYYSAFPHTLNTVVDVLNKAFFPNHPTPPKFSADIFLQDCARKVLDFYLQEVYLPL